MKNTCAYSLLLFCMLLISSCDSDENPLVLEENGCVLLGDKYIEATTDFTDEEAVEILKSEIWCEDGYPYIYNDKQMVKVYGGYREPTYYRFKEGGIFESSPELSDLRKDNGPEFEYSVKDGLLTLRFVYRDKLGFIYSEWKSVLKLVAVDKSRIILDSDGIGTWVPDDFPIKDNGKAKTRSVFKTVK